VPSAADHLPLTGCHTLRGATRFLVLQHSHFPPAAVHERLHVESRFHVSGFRDEVAVCHTPPLCRFALVLVVRMDDRPTLIDRPTDQTYGTTFKGPDTLRACSHSHTRQCTTAHVSTVSAQSRDRKTSVLRSVFVGKSVSAARAHGRG